MLKGMSRTVSKLLADRYGIEARNLGAAFRRAGGRLPRHIRKAGLVLAEAEADSRNPGRRPRHEETAVVTAYDRIVTYLKEDIARSLSLAEKRAQRRSALRRVLRAWATEAGGRLLILGGLVAGWLALRSHI
jgi:hypothetical protein